MPLSSEPDRCTQVRYAAVINTGNVTDGCLSSLSPRCSLTVLQLYIHVHDTVKLQIFVRYLFSYFRLETGSDVLIFVLSRVCEENDVEMQWLQSKKKFSYDIKFRTFQKY